jgi:nucleotide-binding universal stress UspA family protein
MSERQDLESVGGLQGLPLDTRQTGNTELAEIVVFLDGRSETTGILKFAGVLAQEHDAHLIGVFIQPEPKVTPAETFAVGVGTLAVVEAHRAQLEKIERRQRALFEDIVTHQGIRSEWRSLTHWSSDVGVAAHYADLSVIAHSERSGEASPSGLAESLILTSGRPVVLFPLNGTVSRIRRILVGWNASREAVRAVADALPFLVRAEAIEVLAVDPEHYRDHGQEPGADIARHLTRHGAKVSVRRVSSGGEDIGRVLLSRAVSFGADLLAVGAYGHSRLSEWIFGGVTQTMLREAELPVLMSR